MRLVGPDARYRRVRCGRRSCPYCDGLEARELARVIELDAVEDPPVGVMLLTTRDPADHGESFRRALEQVTRALRRRWPAFEYMAFVEFTSGEAATARGARRMHAHVLVKGVPGDALDAVAGVAGDVWADRMGAGVVTCEPVRSLPALARYLTDHHRKPGQAPPPWWSGKRVRPSRGYYGRPVRELRAEAKATLSADRRRWAARQRLSAGASLAEVEAESARVAASVAGHAWRVVRVRESVTGVVTPLDGGSTVTAAQGSHLGPGSASVAGAERGPLAVVTRSVVDGLRLT